GILGRGQQRHRAAQREAEDADLAEAAVGEDVDRPTQVAALPEADGGRASAALPEVALVEEEHGEARRQRRGDRKHVGLLGGIARTLLPDPGSVAVKAVRPTIGGAILVFWVLATAGTAAFTTISAGAWMLLAVSIVTAIAIGDTVFFESTRALGVGRAMTISTTYPVGVAAIAAVFLDEPVTLPIAIGT